MRAAAIDAASRAVLPRYGRPDVHVQQHKRDDPDYDEYQEQRDLP